MTFKSLFHCTRTHGALLGVLWRIGVKVGWNWTICSRYCQRAGLRRVADLERYCLKRPAITTHVVLLPRLLYQEEWRSRFEKLDDFWFIMHRGSVWPHSYFEPLIIGICFPLSRSYPWELKQHRERMVGLCRTMSKVSQTFNIRVRDHLRKLWRNLRPV